MHSIFQKQGSNPAAIQTGNPTVRQLLNPDFKASNKQFTVNQPYVAAEYIVPLGHTAALLPGRKVRLYLMAQYIATFAALGAAADVVVNLGAAGLDIVKSARKAPAFGGGGTTAHPDAKAKSKIGAGAWTDAPVKAIDYDANTVTVACPAGATSVDLRFLPGIGEVVLRASRPTGSDQAAPQLERYSLRSLHESDQSFDRTALMFSDLKELPQRWKVGFEVTSPVAIPFDAFGLAVHEIVLPTALTPTNVLDASRFDAVAELSLRNGVL